MTHPEVRDFGDAVHPGDSGPSHSDQQPAFFGSEPIYAPPSEEDEEEGHAREVSSWNGLPWWKRPSPYWLVFGTFFGSLGFAALLAPKVALYTALVCRVHRPESLDSSTFPLAHNFVLINATDAPVSHILDRSETTVDGFPDLLLNSSYTSTSGYSQNEHERCASDPVVQAVVARLNAVFNTSMGILSFLTAGWWGSLSDRYGRRTVLFVSMSGLFVTEFTHVITAWFMHALPGGYWFPLIGFLIEGLCGSMPSGVAMTHAYIADTTDTSTRSRYFSLLLGLMFTGVAIGPALGGFLIRSTGTLLSVFYFATILHGAYAILVLLILPESLTRARSRGACLRWKQEKANRASSGRALDFLKSIARFLSPLAVLLPKQSWDTNSSKWRVDWSLFFLALGYALVTSTMGAFSYKFQYAAAQFDWTPEVTSYYVSFIGATRATFLAVVLPLVIRYFKASPVQLPSEPDEPLRGALGPSSSRSASLHPAPPRTNTSEQRLPASRPPTFDLALARTSAGLETTAFLGMAVATTGTFFTLTSTINSFAAGFSPAAQALALDIYTNHHSQNQGEVGKLFGALSVLQALVSQIISPALYGFVYFNTVAAFPQAIMIVSMCTSLVALISLMFVRIPSKQASDYAALEDWNERGSQDTAIPEIQLAVEDEVIGGR